MYRTRSPGRSATRRSASSGPRRPGIITAVTRGASGAAGAATVVLDQEDRLRATDRPLRRPASGCLCGTVGWVDPGQVDLERRAHARLAVDPDVAAALLDDPVCRGKPQAGALAGLLRREERLPQPGPPWGRPSRPP